MICIALEPVYLNVYLHKGPRDTASSFSAWDQERSEGEERGEGSVSGRERDSEILPTTAVCTLKVLSSTAAVAVSSWAA